MKEIRKAFRSDMVQAILRGEKTETRRKLPQAIAVGDIICVCEKFARLCKLGEHCRGKSCSECYYIYEADATCADAVGVRWRSPRFMPSKACRLKLRVEAVCEEPLLAISEADAISEGVGRWPDGNYKVYGQTSGKYTYARDSFLSLWDEIYGEGAHKENPDVAVISFEVFLPRLRNQDI
jgi:hypothetical protein